MRINYFLLIVLLCSGSLFAQPVKMQDKTPIKVLFVGNSFTSFYNLPQVVAAMAKTQGTAIEARMSAVGSSNLEQHWKAEKGTKTMELLENAKWDYVVFNNHSRSAYETPESFMTYGKKFAEKVKELGATPVFMITWAYKSNPLMQDKITKAYVELAKETGAEVVPAGPLFDRARTLRPDLNLFHDDKHPSANGTYLIGLAFYKFFEQKPVKDITGTLRTTDKNGETITLTYINNPDAVFLQQLVDEFDFKNYLNN